MRKMISFKLENFTDKQRQIIDTWADNQANIQQSLANLVMHVVEYVGNVDVMDYDVQRKLHTMFTPGAIETIPGKVEATPGAIEEAPGSVESVDNVNDEAPGKEPAQTGNDVIDNAFEVFDE